jgi:hypothetical protein
MERQTITANYLQTICWEDDVIADWGSGYKYWLTGNQKQLGYSYKLGDSAIQSANGVYVFIYQKFGTKGLLLKNGALIKEINRPYYCADVYEFPAAFVTLGVKTYLVHCPVKYNQLDFEDVETGALITNIPDREPEDHFYSRLEISPGGTYLMSKGWVWHPLDMVVVFDIKKCISNPRLLDKPQFMPNVGAEVCTASFIDNNTVVIGSSNEVLDNVSIESLPPKHICLWNLETSRLFKQVKVSEDFGNLFAINANYAWDLYGFPKIIDLNTGEIIERNDQIDSGKQQSAIINQTDHSPSIIYNKQTSRIAIKLDDKIEVLTPSSRL